MYLFIFKIGLLSGDLTFGFAYVLHGALCILRTFYVGTKPPGRGATEGWLTENQCWVRALFLLHAQRVLNQHSLCCYSSTFFLL